MKFWNSFLWALFACLVSMGTMLLPQYTTTVLSTGAGVSKANECLLIGPNWECTKRAKETPYVADPGAVLSQELPGFRFFNKNLSGDRPQWNPYIGSGYPIVLDGMLRAATPSVFLMTHFPSYKARDIIIFFRFVFWSWGILYAISLLNVTGGYLFFIGLASTVLPYVSKFTDIIFLDVDMLVPWIFALFLRVRIKQDKFIYVSFFFLGLWIGLQSFVEAQVSFGLVLALCGIAFYKIKRRAIYSILAFSIPYLAFSLPYALQFASNLSELISNRSFGGCPATIGVGWRETFQSSFGGFSHEPEATTAFTIFGIPLLAWLVISRCEIRPLFYLYGLAVLWFILGFFSFVCPVPGMSSILFYRHLMPVVESLFLILSAVAIHDLSAKLNGWKSVFAKIILLYLILVPIQERHFTTLKHLTGRYPKALEITPSPIPVSSIYKEIQTLSQAEDRRHFSPDGRLYPNFSSQFEILDMRILYGVYPVRWYTLNDSLYKGWASTPASGHADRFVGTDISIEHIPKEFEKIMILNRVSLLSFGKKIDWLSNTDFYTKERCKKLGEDVLAVSYICDEVGGVGYFPKRIKIARDRSQSLQAVLNMSTADSNETAVIETLENNLRAGSGKVLNVVRTANELSYNLEVRESGIFVVSDSMFVGWTVQVNDNESEIYPANLAFKSVFVPTGRVKVLFHFSL